MKYIDTILFVIGLVCSSYAFSRGVPIIGLFFIIIMIIGLLMNPPKCIPVEYNLRT
jgi:membrane-bound ClpP family serine protease